MKMTGKFLGAAMLAAISGFSVPAHADVKAGVDAWERGDYPGAISQWRGPALSGDADAQFNLGQAYKLGRGVPMDLAKAEEWFRKAADQGHVQAADNYGLILFQTNRREQAMPYIRTSAARGEPRAQYVLGTAHFNGDLAEKDWVQAYALMTRASATGLPQASKSLATMDQYIPIEQRQKGQALAADMARAARFAGDQETQTMATGALPPDRTPVSAPALLRSAAPPSAIASAQVPPSTTEPPASQPEPQEPFEGYVPSVAAPAPDDATEAQSGSDTTVSASVPTVPASEPFTAASATAMAAVDPVAQRSGDWRIQLGAFSSKDKTQALWRRLQTNNASLSGLQSYFVGTGNITRLQAGPFASKSEADEVCRMLGDQPCFAVKK